MVISFCNLQNIDAEYRMSACCYKMTKRERELVLSIPYAVWVDGKNGLCLWEAGRVVNLAYSGLPSTLAKVQPEGEIIESGTSYVNTCKLQERIGSEFGTAERL